MLRLLSRCALLFVLSLPLARAESAGEGVPTRERVIVLLQVTGAAEMGLQVMDMLIGSFRDLVPQVPDHFWHEFRAEVKADEMQEMIVPIYQRHLSAGDVEEAIRFFQTPAGRRFIEKQPVMMHEGQALGELWGQQLGERALKKLREKGFVSET